MGFALEAAAGISSSSHIEPIADRAGDRSTPKLPAAIAVAVVALVAIVVWYARRPDRANGAEKAVPPAEFRQLSFESANSMIGRFAPDGRTVVYSSASIASGSRLLLTRLE